MYLKRILKVTSYCMKLFYQTPHQQLYVNSNICAGKLLLIPHFSNVTFLIVFGALKC